MSGPSDVGVAWESPDFWGEFESLESRHQSSQRAYDAARRALDQVKPGEREALLSVWREFRAAVAALDDTVDAIAELQSSALASPRDSST